ncbi:MAG: DUF721 domain-containing protein [Bacillota bacterium]
MIKAGSLIKDYFQRKNLKGKTESLTYTGIWKRVTGKNIERYTLPVALKNGTLFVEVEDSIWLYELTLLKEKIISDFNAISGEMVVSDIVFRNTGFPLRENNLEKELTLPCQKKDSFMQKKKLTMEKLGASETAEIKKIIQYMPESFQERMSRLLNNFFRLQEWKKEQGARVCPRCRSLFFPGDGAGEGKTLCHICGREK